MLGVEVGGEVRGVGEDVFVGGKEALLVSDAKSYDGGCEGTVRWSESDLMDAMLT